MTQAYCVRCKEKVNIKDAHKVTSSNGRNMIKGECSHCGGKVSVFTK